MYEEQIKEISEEWANNIWRKYTMPEIRNFQLSQNCLKCKKNFTLGGTRNEILKILEEHSKECS